MCNTLKEVSEIGENPDSFREIFENFKAPEPNNKYKVTFIPEWVRNKQWEIEKNRLFTVNESGAFSGERVYIRPVGNYLEPPANGCNEKSDIYRQELQSPPKWLEINGKKNGADFEHGMPGCLQGWVEGRTNFVHATWKAVLCGREWCPWCGRLNSWIHKRRESRWIPKAFQWIAEKKTFGYLVVTFPMEIRDALKDRDTLNEIRNYFRRKLKREGFSKGLARWHWAGDCKKCKGDGCKSCKWTGADSKWNPHLNFLFEAGYIDKKEMEIWGKDFNRWAMDFFKSKLKNKFEAVREKFENLDRKLVWNYRYFPGTMDNVLHKIKYVTRATLRKFNQNISDVLFRYHTSAYWGKWENLTSPEIVEIMEKFGKETDPGEKEVIARLASYKDGICWMDKMPIKWIKFHRTSLINTLIIMCTAVDSACGYILTPDYVKLE